MSLRIATNVQSLAAQRFLTQNHDRLNTSLEHLASGSRINRAGDDAAGLAISERLRANIRSLNQASRNANDGVSLVQVAEGAMNEVSNILIRMRELSIQSASDTIGNTERGFIDKEIQQLKTEVDRIANTTEYNGYKLLDGQLPSMEIQVGIHNNPAEDRLNLDTKKFAATTDILGIVDITTMSKEASQANLDKLDAALNRVSEGRADMGALQNRLGSTINNLAVYTENLSAANSRIRDTDMAHETSEMTKYNILSNTNVSVLAQANQTPTLALKLVG